jgi:hypothetical protein|tara:strand:+ start:373 stop:495 length:123 start_codon:yes stop_codon:yes gene_type:complete
MKTIIKAGSLRGAEALLAARSYTIANAVRRNGIWEVTSND